MLDRDALRHAAPRLHLHHRLQVGDDEADGWHHDGPLPCLRHRLPRPLRVLDHLPVLSHSKGNSFFVDNKTGLILPQPLPTFAPHLKYRPRRFPNEICPVRSQCCPLLTVTPFIIVTNFVYGRQEIKSEQSDALPCEKLDAA